mgnify:CR=1 FL=1
MRGIKQELDLLTELQGQAGKLQKSAEVDIAEASKIMKALQGRVKDGETTGDRIKDFVLVRYGFLSDEIEAVYRDIEKRVKAHVGEFVFVFSAKDEHEGCTGFGGKGYYVRKNNLYLGILKKDFLILDKPDKGCSFPTERFVCFEDSRKCKTIDKNLSEDSVKDGIWSKANFGLSLQETEGPVNFRTIFRISHRGEEESPELVLKIGDKEVDEWFLERNFIGLISVYEKMALELGRPRKL